MGAFYIQKYTGQEGGGVAGYENIKNKGFDHRTTEERRELAKIAGKKSGEARRRKADFRRTLNLLLTAEVDNDMTPILHQLGLESTLETAMLMAQIKEAMQGNTKAAYFVAEYAGQSCQTEADDKEQQIRTERANRAKEQEVGDANSANDNISEFLKAMNPTKEVMDALFADEEENNAEETEETGEV